MVHVGVALAILQGAQLLMGSFQFAGRLPPAVQVLVSGLLGATLFVPVAAGLDLVFPTADDLEDAGASPISVLWEEMTGSAGPVLLVWMALNFSRLISVKADQGEGNHGPVGTDGEASFWSRVPKETGRDLVALSAELHYMRVHTTTGQALILYPFGTAVNELASEGGGIQIHRSHWVRIDQIVCLDREGQAARCTLSSGLVLPVSRSRRGALEAVLAKVRHPAMPAT